MSPIRVLVVEDSATVRELLVAILESDPELEVIGQAGSGAEAVELAARLAPDLITMDVHMPGMDGLQATKEIMVRAPAPIIVVSSSDSREEVQRSLDAVRAGALMVVAKPDDPRSPGFTACRAQFLAMAKAMSQVKIVRRRGWSADAGRASAPRESVIRPPGARVRLVAIAASTGGPAALQRILGELPRDYPAPVLVVQHIAAGFVDGLAGWLGSSTDLQVKVAEPGEALRAHHVYLAPDDRHLCVSHDGRVDVADGPRVDGFRPSATRLFESAARAYGAAVAAVILTGMGNDGVAGLRAVKAAGGRVLAQDEASCVVFGMPRAAAASGVVDSVLGLDGVAPMLVALTGGVRQRVPAAPAPRVARPAPRILLVEDSATYGELATILLESLGCAVAFASSAEDGLRTARETRPDLILMDMNLPDMDGLDAVRSLRTVSHLARTPVVAMTSGRVSQADQLAAREAGFSTFVEKPIDEPSFRRLLAPLVRLPGEERDLQ